MFSEHHFQSDDGLHLYYRTYPNSNSGLIHQPLICLPGITRNSKDFHDLAVLLSQEQAVGRKIICVDYRGRGKSDWDPNKENYNVKREALDVIQLLEHLNVSKASFIGTSRGGLVILMMAALQPGCIESAIFNDIGPELDISGLLDIKKYLDANKTPKNWDEAAQIQK